MLFLKIECLFLMILSMVLMVFGGFDFCYYVVSDVFLSGF